MEVYAIMEWIFIIVCSVLGLGTAFLSVSYFVESKFDVGKRKSHVCNGIILLCGTIIMILYIIMLISALFVKC